MHDDKLYSIYMHVCIYYSAYDPILFSPHSVVGKPRNKTTHDPVIWLSWNNDLSQTIIMDVKIHCKRNTALAFFTKRLCVLIVQVRDSPTR